MLVSTGAALMQAPPVSRQLYLDAARRVIGAAHDEVAQPPEKLAATRTWRDRSIPSRWIEKIDRNAHPHIKPIGLITRLIGAVTKPGDLVVDPAAGSFLVRYLHPPKNPARHFPTHFSRSQFPRRAKEASARAADV